MTDNKKTSRLSRRSAGWLAGLLIMFIRLYQSTLSPYIGGHCRFVPTCSEYCIAAIDEHGPARGLWMGLARILRCHPLSPGGFDPVKPGREAE